MLSALTPSREFLHSRDFRLAAQRSELRRSAMMIAVLFVLVAMTVLRHAAGGAVMQGRTFAYILALGVTATAVEIAFMIALRRATRERRLFNDRDWAISAVLEALVPTVAVLIVQLTSPIGPREGFTTPSLLIYGVIICLGVLRLRPALCLLSGVVAAAGCAALVVIASRDSAANAVSPFSWPTMMTYPVLVLLTGIVAAMVAEEIRSYVAAALHEATERQRVQLVARNTLIFGLAKLAEYRDTDTGAHLERISAYAGILGEALRERSPAIDEHWIQTLRVASSMHDIGKVGVPDAVLLKPGRLTPDEREVIETHPRLGADALQAILDRHGTDALLEMSVQIAACHHERWDGTGYPEGLAGERIPLPARIIAVADVYDALTSPRVYKPALSHDEARRMIFEGRGTQFDPAIVDAFDRSGPRFDAARRRLAQTTPAHGAFESVKVV